MKSSLQPLPDKYGQQLDALEQQLRSREVLLRAVKEISRAKELSAVLEIVRVAARELTGADGATFVLREGEQCYYAEENAIAPLWKGQRFPIDACISGWVMTHHEPVVIADIDKDPRIPHDVYRQTFVKSLVMVPIRAESPLGAIGNYWAENRVPTEDEVALLQTLADTTAVVLESLQSESHLKENDERFHLLVDSVQDYAIFMLDTRGYIKSWNRGAERIKGYTEDEILGRHFSCFYPEEVQKQGYPEFELAEATKTGSFEDEGWRIRKNGSRFWANVIITAIRDKKGELVGFSKVTRDLSERRQAEKKLGESLKELKDIKYALDTSTIVAFTDQQGTITYVNDAFCKISKYSKEELLGQNHRIINSGHHPHEFFVEMWKTIGSGKVWQGEIKNRAKDGSYYWVDTTIVPLLDHHGKPYQHVAIRHDITQQKKVEDALRHSEKQLSDFFDNAVMGLHWVGPDGTILRANKAELELLGYAPEEYIGHNITEFHVDEPVINDILTRLGRNEKLEEYEARLRCKDGSIRHVRINSSVFWDNGRFVHTRCFTQDVTERKQAEAALRESEEQFRMLANSIAQLAWIADPDGWIYWYNNRWYDYTGTSLEEMQGWGWQKVHHPDHIDRILEFMKEAWGKGEPIELTFPLRGKDGNYRWFLTRAYPVKDAEGRVIRWIGTNTDIEEQMQTEATLRESEERFRTMADSAPVLIWVSDKENKATYLNKQWLEYTGRTLEQELGYGWMEAIHPDDIEQAMRVCSEGKKAMQPFSMEFRLRRADGEYRWFMDTATPRYTSDGKCAGYIGTCVDIHERQQADEARQKNIGSGKFYAPNYAPFQRNI